MKKFTNQQAVFFIKQSTQQSSYMSSIMSHELEYSGSVRPFKQGDHKWVATMNKETADFLRAMADALELSDESQQG